VAAPYVSPLIESRTIPKGLDPDDLARRRKLSWPFGDAWFAAYEAVTPNKQISFLERKSQKR